MFHPAYYQGRRVHVFRAKSHPVTYVYTWVRHSHVSPVSGKKWSRLYLAKTDAFWSDEYRKKVHLA